MILDIHAEVQAFEDASFAHYNLMRVQGLAKDDNPEPITREGLFWRNADGSYGVATMNAAWWGWFNRALAQAQMSLDVAKH